MKKIEAAADKQRKLDLAKETLKRDAKPSSVVLEKTMWQRKKAAGAEESALSPVVESPREEMAATPPAVPAAADEGGDLEGAALEVLKDIEDAMNGGLI